MITLAMLALSHDPLVQVDLSPNETRPNETQKEGIRLGLWPVDQTVATQVKNRLPGRKKGVTNLKAYWAGRCVRANGHLLPQVD